VIDLGLLAALKKAVTAKPRKFLTPAILGAVVLQESGGVPYFIDTKPGSLYRLNILGAVKYRHVTDRSDGTRTVQMIETGIREREIRDVIMIPPMVEHYQVPKIMRGQLAKFRFEPSYWVQYPNLAKMDRFLYSCSWGLGQVMAPHLGQPDALGFNFIRRFMADTDLQLLYAAGMVEELLERADGDVLGAYKGYNSGDVNSENAAVIARAQIVARSAQQIQRYVDQREAPK
jgi:hypothetical protein